MFSLFILETLHEYVQTIVFIVWLTLLAGRSDECNGRRKSQGIRNLVLASLAFPFPKMSVGFRS